MYTAARVSALLALLFAAAPFAPGAAPLSLAQARVMLEDMAVAIGDGASSPSAARIEAARERLRAVQGYMEAIAMAAATRVRYEWTAIDKKRVDDNEIKNKRFSTSRAMRGVGAARFHPGRGDVYLMRMVVRDPQGGERTYVLDRWALDSMPRQETYYFDEPLDVTDVILTMGHQGERSRRMTLLLGIPDRRPYAREVATMCAQALRALNDRQWVEARQRMQAAAGRLAEYEADRARRQSGEAEE